MDVPQFSFKGKVALITGGSRGIGKATAIAFAKAGADVAVASRKLLDLEKVADEIRALGRKSLAMKVDVADSKQIYAAVREVLEQWGKIDILVNNAGFSLVERFIEGSEDEWERVIAVDLMGPILFCRAVLDGMIERKHGKIINIASDAARTGSTGQVVYGAAKGGIISFTRSLAIEMARYGLNINCVSPGLVNTAMWNATREAHPKLAQAYEGLIPWKRLGEAEEVASAVLFLASDEAQYITGQTISVNGGVVTY